MTIKVYLGTLASPLGLLSLLALNQSSRSMSSFWFLTTQSIPNCVITRFLLLAGCDLNQKIKNDTTILQRQFPCDTGTIRHCVVGEAFVKLQISPLNLFVNSLLPLTFHLLILLLQIDRKERALILLRIQEQKRKKIREFNFFKNMHSYCNQAIRTAVEKNLMKWKLRPIPRLGPQLAIRKFKVSFVTHFYKFPQRNCLNSTHAIFFFTFFLFHMSFSISVCFQNKELFSSAFNRYTMLRIADEIQSV